GRLLRAERGHDAADDDLEDHVERQLQVERGRYAEHLGDLRETRAHVLQLHLLLANRRAQTIQLELLESDQDAERADEPGEARARVAAIPEGKPPFQELNGSGEREDHQEGDRPQPPAPAVDVIALRLAGILHGKALSRGQDRRTLPLSADLAAALVAVP